MAFKKFLSVVISICCLCSTLCFSSYAEEKSTFDQEVIASEYVIARSPVSALYVNNNSASCSSTTNGIDCVQITVTQTLQKYSGLLWLWNDVSGASWSKTTNQSSISLSHTKSNLSSGTYRLMSVFTLTSSSGETETITIYSLEKTV